MGKWEEHQSALEVDLQELAELCGRIMEKYDLPVVMTSAIQNNGKSSILAWARDWQDNDAGDYFKTWEKKEDV